ncbi:hypothetical protein Metli_1394 [Methanofollis liminatans DSM 4140]|uniref:Uncharacterized protein n=1 Tax=Methanofollis liminatans DSM 4140 TaxID=28892 RepID=J0S0I8_9EURY|nr:hypothetical protein [Methanofollis liminatans]EJG07346.1 hypothetical protein Metli_1394 [Methanofollis liminatans DSM 4140]
MNRPGCTPALCLLALLCAVAAGGCLSGERAGGEDIRPVSVEIEKGDIGPFYETAAAMDDRVVFTFVPTGANVSAYLVTYEVKREGSTVAAADGKYYDGVSASHPIVIAAGRSPGELVSIAISIKTPDGEVVYESASSVG